MPTFSIGTHYIYKQYRSDDNMDKQKADRILIAHLPRIYDFSEQKCFSHAEAEELSAEIVSELYGALIRTDELFSPAGYIRRICEHVYARYVASVKKHRGISLDRISLPAEDFRTVQEQQETEEELQPLRREIAFLTGLRRKIVYAYYYENQPIAQIAKQNGIPVGTVKWHLNKARLTLKEGLVLERNIGTLGMSPVKAIEIGHSGTVATDCPEDYLGNSLDLNIVYSVYFTPRTKEEIAQELGVTPVYIEDRVDLLEQNGFLVRKAKGKYTTYVYFTLPYYSLEAKENRTKKRLQAAQMLAEEYVPQVRRALSGIRDVYIPGGNRELLEAAAVFFAVENMCQLRTERNLSRYYIRTTKGSNFIALVDLEARQTDPGYIPTLNLPSMGVCGDMYRISEKYPVFSWSADSRYSSRTGGWQNNRISDYEYLYEFMTGAITDTPANAEKFNRLRERQFISEDNRINIMVTTQRADRFFTAIPELNENLKKRYADDALESAQIIARDYPPQMRDLVISRLAGGFVSSSVAVMVMDILYGNGTFRPLTEQEKITSNLILFTDRLPGQ